MLLREVGITVAGGSLLAGIHSHLEAYAAAGGASSSKGPMKGGNSGGS